MKNIAIFIVAKGYANNPSDVDGSAFPAIDLVSPDGPLKNSQYYEEFQLQGTLGPVDFIAGRNIDLTRQPRADAKINVPTNTFDGAGFDQQFGQSRYSSYSAFGSLTFHANDRLNISAAARHTWDSVFDKSILPNNNPQYVSDALAPGQFVNCSVNSAVQCSQFLTGSHKFRGWSDNLGVDYRLSDDIMVYGGYRHGRERAAMRSWQMKALQKFASLLASLHNHLNSERHLVVSQTFKARRSIAMVEWQSLIA